METGRLSEGVRGFPSLTRRVIGLALAGICYEQWLFPV